MNAFKELPISVIVENTMETASEVELFHAAKFLNNPSSNWLENGNMHIDNNKIVIQSNVPMVNYREIMYASIMGGWKIKRIELFINKSSINLDTMTQFPMVVNVKDANGVRVAAPIRLRKDKDQHQSNIMVENVSFRIDSMASVIFEMPPQTEISVMFFPEPEKAVRKPIWKRLLERLFSPRRRRRFA